MFRNNKDWLEFRVDSLIKREHSDIYTKKRNRLWNCIWSYLKSRNGWWVILCLVILFFLFCLLNWSAFDCITLTFDSAKIIVDQRISNIATIISITLVVVGFLINNLAVKESYAYHLLFKRSYLYPILYFILSTIGCFALISALRDSFEPYQFKRLSLTGTYAAIIILALIGFLFRRIIYFTDYKHIESILENELLLESKVAMENILKKKYSEKLFKEFLEENAAVEYDWTHDFKFAYSVTEVLPENEPKIIRRPHVVDINLKNISKFIKHKNNGKTIYYKPLKLRVQTEYYNNFVWFEDYKSELKDNNELERCLVLDFSEKKNETKNKIVYRNYFEEKLEEFSEKNKYRNLENILKSFSKIYAIQMENQNK